MTTLWTSEDAVAATGGRTTRDWEATGVSIDTRSIEPGELFIALKAERDGHDFVADALAKGAAVAMVSRVPEGISPDAPLLIVDDVQIGLEALGRAGRARCRAKVIGVTGSVGKTSTKKMIRDALATQAVVYAAEKSFNNHWGVPLTLARIPANADYVVVEIGMNAPGEIAPLAKLARLHAAIITTIGPAHLEAFDNIEGIAHEKASIFEGLEPGGVAIVNGDVPEAPILRAAGEARAERTISFGETAAVHHRMVADSVVDDTTVVQARAWRTPLLFKLGTSGRHFAVNAMAVLATVWALGGDRARAMIALADWRPPGGRGLRRTLALDVVDDHLTFDLIDDAFNANPASMAAALETLAASQPVNGMGRIAEGRRIAVLGDMLELGPEEQRLHCEIADHPAMETTALVHCVGPRMKALWNTLPPEKRGHWVESAETLVPKARGLVDAGDVILVKGSKGSRVSLLADALSEIGHKPAKVLKGEL